MKKSILLVCSLLFNIAAFSNVKLPALVGNHMVLQRDKPIKIWGYADENEAVKVRFAGNTITTTSINGKWHLELPAMKAGGPFKMMIEGNNKIELEDILIGDVWLCSGQSNMEFNLKDAANGEYEVERAKNPSIRLFSVEKRLELTPIDDTKGKWAVCTPETAKYFSAVGYFFARDINNTLNVPIGLINASWGGTLIETWISKDGLKSEASLESKALSVPGFDTSAFNSAKRKQHEIWVNNFEKNDQGFGGKYLWAQNSYNFSNWETINLPTIWEFTAIEELTGTDGVVWFKKEVELTENDLNKPAALNLGVIQNSNVTFVNGVQVGFTPDEWGRNTSYNIPDFILKPGKNVVTVRISNYGGDGGFASKPEALTLTSTHRTIDLSGEWKFKVGYKLSTYDRPEKEFGPNTAPTLLFNSMINPVGKFSIKGALWYQGESNWFRGYQYRDLFPRMIADWRAKFKHHDLPFLFVQLANYQEKQVRTGNSYWAEVREAQDMTLKLKRTGMATAIDIGDAGNIHPTNKQEVGRRLALVAKNMVYDIPVVASGPRYQSFQKRGNILLVKFTSVAAGLKAKSTPVGGFQIAGENKVFEWAKAEIIDKNTVKVYHDAISSPVALRYAWEDNPSDANLINSVNLPAPPFRTDQWPGISYNNK